MNQAIDHKREFYPCEDVYETVYERRRDILYIRLPKELDHYSGQGVKEVTEAYANACQIRMMVFDFSRTEFMDSTGIGILLSRYKFMKAQGGTVAVKNASSRMRRILQLAGIDQLIPSLEA